MHRFATFVVVVLVLIGLGFKKALTPVALQKNENGDFVLGFHVPLMLLVRFVNFVMDPFKRQLLPINVEIIRELALAEGENLSDFIGTEIMDPRGLESILLDIDANAHFLGRFLFRDMLATNLALQWRLSQIIESHPEVLQEQIMAPLVLTGLPRSGTTYFYQVLADSGLGLRFPRVWEVFGGSPVPLKALRLEDVASERDPRVIKARSTLELLKSVPSLFGLHEWHGLMEPEEEVTWLIASFAVLRIDSPGSLVRMMQTDPHVKYRFLKRVLQVAQWENWMRTGERPRWLLKAPDHLSTLNALVAIFPDVKLVTITRDVMTALKSLVILTHYINSIYRTPTVEESVLTAKAYICLGLEGLNMLPTLLVNKTFVTFEQVTRETEASVERIARFAGLEWGRIAATKLKDGIKRRQAIHKQKPRLVYKMDDFGLNDTAIQEMLGRCPGDLREMRAGNFCDISMQCK